MTGVTLASSDITLSLDKDGVILEATVSANLPEENVLAWVGRPWTETVGAPDGEQIRGMMADAQRNGLSAFHALTQRFPSGREYPIEYTLVRVGAKGGLVVVGRSRQAVDELQSRLLATQRAREQDYWKLREIETRSRFLFDSSGEAVLLVGAERLDVLEANPAAIRGLGVAPGWNILDEIAPADQAAFRSMLLRARDGGRAPGMVVRVGAAQVAWTMRASLMATEPGQVFMLHLTPPLALEPPLRLPSPVSSGLPQGASPGTAAGQRQALALAGLLERLPDGFVLASSRGDVLQANPSFLDMVQAAAPAVVLGQSLGRWLQQSGADLDVVLAALARHGAVRLFSTVLTGELGSTVQVEISAVSGGDQGMICLVLRDISRRLHPTEGPRDLRAVLESLTASMSDSSLPELVRLTSDIVERHCIENALARCNGNRRATADMLGLSRQSLYGKLKRHGIDRGGEDNE
jgi:PAS domain-containing protein/DNA-binding protein Fis